MVLPAIEVSSHRGRRCALIPNGVILTPEEERLVINRIGHRPIPPPGALTSSWFVNSKKCVTGKSKVLAIDSGGIIKSPEVTDSLELENQITWGGTSSSGKRHNENDVDTEMCPSNSNCRNTDEVSKHAVDSSMPVNLRRQASWSVDIPHMSEIQPLKTRSTAEMSTSAMQSKQYQDSSMTRCPRHNSTLKAHAER